jgi:hypothetical protein
MKLQRNHWILLALLLILTVQIGRHIWAHWGLITVHSKTTPLAQVIRSIEKQGHVTIKTNMDLTKPVYMNVDEVSLTEAMETLATVMEGGWRLTYFVGPDKGTVAGAISTFTAGQKNEGWKMMYVRMPPIVGEDTSVALADPRKDSWVVKPAKEPTLQSYLQEASRNVSASFWVPASWNPPVNSPPKTGAIGKALPKLVSAAKGKYEEVILLQGSNRQAGDRPERGGGGGEDEPRFAGNFGGGGRGGFNRDAMEERIENEIAKLPEDQRKIAQAERDQRKKMFDDMKDLTDEERRQRMQDMMNTPDAQAKMDDQMNKQANRMSPEQRVQRAQKYLQKVAAARQAAGKQ